MDIFRKINKPFGFLKKHFFGNTCICYNSNRACIAKTKRLTYTKMYPTLLVHPDGSTSTIRYHEPRMIIKLPPDMDVMSEEEKRKYLNKQKPKDDFSTKDEIEDTFDPNQYLKLFKG